MELNIKIPEQCADCKLLKFCFECRCLKEKPCRERITEFPETDVEVRGYKEARA